MTSKVQSSPRWLQKMPSPSTSNGVAAKRSATPATSGRRRRGRRHSGRRSDGSARGRRSGRSWGGSAPPRRSGRAHPGAEVWPRAPWGGRLWPTERAAIEGVGGDPGTPQPGGDPFAELQPLLADDHGRTPRELARPVAHGFERPAETPGISRGSAAKSSSVWTSISAGTVRPGRSATLRCSRGSIRRATICGRSSRSLAQRWRAARNGSVDPLVLLGSVIAAPAKVTGCSGGAHERSHQYRQPCSVSSRSRLQAPPADTGKIEEDGSSTPLNCNAAMAREVACVAPRSTPPPLRLRR